MKNKRKTWILSEIYYPVDTSTGYYMTEIAESLSSKGKDVHVISTMLKYSDLEEDMQKIEVRNDVHIRRVKALFKNKNNPIKRLLNALFTSLKLSYTLFKSCSKGDQILAVTNPIFLVLFLPLVVRLKQLDYTLLIHDVFPENLFAIKSKTKRSLFDKFLQRLFDKAYSKPNQVIVIGRDMAKVIAGKTKNKVSVYYIPIWSQNKEITRMNKVNTVFLKGKEYSNKRILQFAGNLGYAQGIDAFLEVLMTYKSDKLHFMFIGDGAMKDCVLDYATKDSRISLYPYQKRNTQNDFLNASDIAIVTLASGMLGLGVPSKTYNILAAGKPILLIADSESEIALLINENKIGWVVEPNNAEDLKSVLLSIEKMSASDLEEISHRCRVLADSCYSKEFVLNEYFKLLS